LNTPATFSSVEPVTPSGTFRTTRRGTKPLPLIDKKQGMSYNRSMKGGEMKKINGTTATWRLYNDIDGLRAFSDTNLDEMHDPARGVYVKHGGVLHIPYLEFDKRMWIYAWVRKTLKQI